MCGIGVFFLSNFKDQNHLNDLRQASNILLSNRGPDSISEINVEDVALQSTVLHIQGIGKVTAQPYVDQTGNALQWNGEVFSGLSTHRVGESDTIAVATLLSVQTAGVFESHVVGRIIADALSCVHGPFAFVFYHHTTRSLFFGRDPFGRRSLAVLRQDGQLLAISSVTVNCSASSWSELPVDGVYSSQLGTSESTTLHLCAEWPTDRLRLHREHICDLVQTRDVDIPSQFLERLTAAVTDRVRCLAESSALDSDRSPGTSRRPCRVGVLFSGGIDSVLLAAVLHCCLSIAEEPIELINVSFEEAAHPPSVASSASSSRRFSPDRLAAIAAVVELQVQCFCKQVLAGGLTCGRACFHRGSGDWCTWTWTPRSASCTSCR